jgi:hypothetical protein
MAPFHLPTHLSSKTRCMLRACGLDQPQLGRSESTSPHTSDPPGAPIFGLPGELRNQIYDLLFDDEFSLPVVRKQHHPHRDLLLEHQGWPSTKERTFGFRLSCRLFARETSSYLMRSISMENAVDSWVIDPIYVRREIRSFARLFSAKLHHVRHMDCAYIWMQRKIKDNLPSFIWDAVRQGLILFVHFMPINLTHTWPKRILNVATIRFRIPASHPARGHIKDTEYIAKLFPAVSEIVYCHYGDDEPLQRYVVRNGHVLQGPH